MNLSDQTVLKRLNITGKEITRRKELAGLCGNELEMLQACRPIIEEEIDVIVEEFYQTQTADREISLLIGDAETLRHLHAVQRQYVLDLFSGNDDLDYVNNRLHIGLVHRRIGVEPKLYLSSLRNLKDLLTKALKRRISDPALLAQACQALDRQFYFDLTLVFDTYAHSLSEAESAKERVESYAAELERQVAQRTRELEQKVRELQAAMAMVKKLEGVIPICGICKKIRNDEQSWEQLEQYLMEHSEALFSHGLCPECFEKELTAIKELKEQKLGRK